MAVYSSGEWHVKPGREKEFVDAWHELADWSYREFDVDGWAKLLVDQEDPTHFRSIGEWPDQQTIDKWRANEEFKQRVAKMRELLSDGQISTMTAKVEVGAALSKA